MEENKIKFTTVHKTVSMVCIEANPWNPNTQEDAIFKKLVQSIKENGFMGSIFVRTIGKDTYQIIDGEHRYKACRELVLESMKIEDIGVIEDDLAKQLTVMFNNLRGQDDVLKRAQILKQLNDGQKALFPWTKEEMENQEQLVAFDFSKYDKEEEITEKKDFTIMFSCTKGEYMLIKYILSVTKKKETMALLAIMEEYISLREHPAKYDRIFHPEKFVEGSVEKLEDEEIVPEEELEKLSTPK